MEYWNACTEILSQEKIKKLQLKKYKRIFKWAYNNSPFYKKLHNGAGIAPGDIKKFEDIEKVQKTDSEEIRQRYEKRITFRRPADPSEIAYAIAFIASDQYSIDDRCCSEHDGRVGSVCLLNIINSIIRLRIIYKFI